MEYNNLVYMSFLNISKQKVVVYYPDQIPEMHSEIINYVDNQIFKSIKRGNGVNDIILEGYSLFFLSDGKEKSGAYLITLGDHYPPRFANSLLSEFVKLVITNGYTEESYPVMLQTHLIPEMAQIFRKFDTVVESDQVTIVKIKAEHAKTNIGKSVGEVIKSVGNMKVLKESSDKLADKSIQMFKSSDKLNKFFRNRRLMIICGAVFASLSLLGIIIGVSVYYATKK